MKETLGLNIMSWNLGLMCILNHLQPKKGTPWAYGKILEQATDRSYEISTSTNKVRRNRIHTRPAASPNTPLRKPI